MNGKIKNKFKPDFIGVGVEKCGTTWLAEMIGAHPGIGFSKTLKNGEKEINFFNNVWAFKHRTSKSKLEIEGIKSYEKYFRKGEVTGEWSNYYAPDPNVARRIKRYFPNVKILFSLRSPVERVLSSYNFRKYVRLDEDSKTFEEAIKNHPEYTVERSVYYPQLKRYFDLFPRENIKVILLDDIKKDNRAALKDIYSFLRVDNSFVPKDVDKKINVARKVKDNFINKAIRTHFPRLLRKTVPKAFTPHMRSVLYSMRTFNNTFNTQPLEKESMKEETRRALLEIFGPDIERTGKLIGRDLVAWAEEKLVDINLSK